MRSAPWVQQTSPKDAFETLLKAPAQRGRKLGTQATNETGSQQESWASTASPSSVRGGATTPESNPDTLFDDVQAGQANAIVAPPSRFEEQEEHLLCDFEKALEKGGVAHLRDSELVRMASSNLQDVARIPQSRHPSKSNIGLTKVFVRSPALDASARGLQGVYDVQGATANSCVLP